MVASLSERVAVTEKALLARRPETLAPITALLDRWGNPQRPAAVLITGGAGLAGRARSLLIRRPDSS